MWWLSWFLKCADAVSLEPTRDLWSETITDRWTESNFSYGYHECSSLQVGDLHASKPHVYRVPAWMIYIKFSSVTQLCLTLCNPVDYSVPGFPVHHQLPEFTQTHVHWVGDAVQPSHPLLSPSPLAFNLPQGQGLFQWVTSGGQSIWSFSISPSNEYSGLISFRIDWLDLLAVQGTLKSLLQHHSSKASILGRSAFFTVQLSHPYMTTGKTIALTRWTFVM